MIRVVAIITVFILGFSTAATAKAEMVEPVTGMHFVWVPEGCFAIEADQIRVKTESVKAKKVAAGDVIEHEPLQDGAVVEVSEMDGKPVVASDDGRICFAKGFWMGKYEVTQGQYQKVMGNNPSAFKKGENFPVERVRWFDAKQFIRQLNAKSGKAFRLPSESEWEYAASGGGEKMRYGADGKAAAVAWYMKNSGAPHAVGGKQANALGLHDMSGNVWEWTADCWNASRNDAPADGSALTDGTCTARVLKGGSWYDAEDYIRISARLWNDTDRSDNNSGFRLVLD